MQELLGRGGRGDWRLRRPSKGKRRGCASGRCRGRRLRRGRVRYTCGARGRFRRLRSCRASAGVLPRSRRLRFGRTPAGPRRFDVNRGKVILSGIGWNRRWCRCGGCRRYGRSRVLCMSRSAGGNQRGGHDRRIEPPRSSNAKRRSTGGEIARCANPHAERAAPAGGHNGGRHGDTSGGTPCGTSPRMKSPQSSRRNAWFGYHRYTPTDVLACDHG
jgi:hypothetical protein